MDAFYYLQQGQQLLERNNESDLVKGTTCFKKANQMTPIDDIIKPQTLYYLAFGHYMLGNIELAFKTLQKAKSTVGLAKRNSVIAFNKLPCEDDIQELLKLIELEFAGTINFDVLDMANFDENVLDFSKLNLSSKKENTLNGNKSLPYHIDKINDEVLFAVFNGMGRSSDDLIFFDIEKVDVVGYNNGYFSSWLGDQNIQNRLLADKIMNHSKKDFVDESRYILIPRLPLNEFMEAYAVVTSGKKEIYGKFIQQFTDYILNDTVSIGIKSLNELVFSSRIQQKFRNNFIETYGHNTQNGFPNFKESYEYTCLILAKDWIRTL